MARRQPDLKPIPWEPPRLAEPEVRELFGDEAERQWTAALRGQFRNLFLNDMERAYAITVPAEL